jgi:hypothetical protein
MFGWIFGKRQATPAAAASNEAVEFGNWAREAEQRSSYMDQLIASRVPGGMPNTAAKIPVLEG